MIRTWLIGKAEHSNIPAVVALIGLKFICYAKWCILPATGVFVDKYSFATGQHSSVIIFQIQFVVKLHNELDDITLTHSVLLFFDPLIHPRFHYIDRH